MPILEVEIVTSKDDVLPPGLARTIADAAGEAMGVPDGQTWVRLRTLPRDQYAESELGLPENVRPVFVTVLKTRMGSPKELKKEAPLLCAAIAQACARPKMNVHILYLPDAVGRMSFGGELVCA